MHHCCHSQLVRYKFIIIALFNFGILSSGCLFSQTDTVVVSIQDSVLMANMHSQLNLSADQIKIIDRIIAKDSEEIDLLDKEHQKIARSEAQSEERDQKLAAIREKKKNLKEMRELNIRLALTPEQWTIYQEKIKPGAPAVIHMGMNHDRSTCKVCIPK